MRILILNYEFPPLGGGGSNACYYLLKELAKSDIVADLVTSSATGIPEIERMDENVTIYKVPIHKRDIHYWTQKEILDYSWKANGKIKELMKNHTYDVIHAFFTVPCGALACLYKNNAPFVVSLRGSDVPGFNKRFGIQYVFLKPMIREIWKKADAVIANSNGLRELALETSPELNVGIILNGIDTTDFKPGHSEDGGEIKILCVSRLIERKGIRFLIEAVARLKSEKIELILVGEGDQEAELKQLVREKSLDKSVIFKGYVSHEKISEIYRSSDIFALPSLNEGMSNALLEAMASGLPVIVTDTGGTSELVDGNGFIVDKSNPEDIVRVLESVIAKPELLKKMGQRSREIAEGLSWHNVAMKYRELYEGLI